MATKGLRANESKYLRSVLDRGIRCFYNPLPTYNCIYLPDEGRPAILVYYHGRHILFVDYINSFRLTDPGSGYSKNTAFSYDRCDSEIKMFIEATTVYSDLLRVTFTLDGRSMWLGHFSDPGIIFLENVNLSHEIISTDLIYLFDNVESYVNKVKEVVERMNAEPEEFSKDRFIALMTERRCKSARK
jgi:hypothetical protein